MMERQMKAYLEYLAKADLESLMQLFAPNAEVVSPLYGIQKASVFYKDLFADTRQSILTFQDCYINEKKRTASINFLYTWKMANGEETNFDCVDIFEFDEQYKIIKLKIIYDTAATRPLFQND